MAIYAIKSSLKMPVKVPIKKAGGVAILYPEGRLTGLAAGPLKTSVQELLDDGVRKFIINFKNTISIDSTYAVAVNSIALNVQRYDGRILLCEAGFDVLPWLEKNSPNLVVYKDEELALSKFEIPSGITFKGNIAVVGTSDMTRELFKGIANYKGLVFHYFDDPLKSIQKVIELKPKGILLNIESGTIVLEPLRQWKYNADTRHCPIIIFGPPSMIVTARALIKEGASDYVEITFDGSEVLAYIKPLDFRNILAKKMDMILEGAYADLGKNKKLV